MLNFNILRLLMQIVIMWRVIVVGVYSDSQYAMGIMTLNKMPPGRMTLNIYVIN
jgi:hypothetical protein